MTKSELREIIRECLREELSKQTSLKESLWTCWFDDKEVGTVSAATEEEAVEKMMQEYPEYPYGLYDGCFGVELVENIKEAAFSGTVASDSSFSGGTVRGMGASTQPDKKNYLGRLKSKNPDLVSTMTIKGKDIKPGMITQAGQVKTAEVKDSRGEKKVYIMHTNDYDGFWGVDEDMEVMADPDDKTKPFTGDYKELLKKGLKESRNRKSMKFYEEFKLYESMWDDATRPATKAEIAQLKEDVVTRESSFDQAEIKACLDRVNANAVKYAPDIDEFGGSIFVSLSEEDLKKALRIGSRGGYTNGAGVTMPAQLVEIASLEIARYEAGYSDICTICLELSGDCEETGESTHDYNNGDIPFVGDISIPGTPIESDEEFIEYVKTNIVPKANQIAHDIINETWNEFGFSDYAGITDYEYGDDEVCEIGYTATRA